MKRRMVLALFSVLMFSGALLAQQPRVQTSRLTAASAATQIGLSLDLRSSGINNHYIIWNASGTVSSCSVKLQQSVDNSVWTDLIAGATCTTNGQSALTAGVANYVRVNATTLTGSGTLTVTYTGFPPGLPASASIAGDVTVIQPTGSNLHVVVDSGGGGGTQYTQDAALTVNSTIGTMAMGRASAAAPTGVGADDDAVIPWYTRAGAQAVQLTNAGVLTLSGSGTATGALRVELPTNGTGIIAGITNAVTVTDGAGALNVICDSGCSGGTQYTQDAALTVATSVMTMAGGRASAAAPTDVSADNDAVMPWYLRSGAAAVQLTNAGVLTVSGSGTATGALRVELPTNGTGVIATVGTITNAVTVTQNTASSLQTASTLQTGSAQIGHLEANQSVNLGQLAGNTISSGNGGTGTGVVRVAQVNDGTGVLATVTNVATIGTSVTPGTAATNLGKAISAAVGATDTGIATLFQRFDTPTTVESTGDYVVPRTDSVGRVWVNCGTGCSGGTQYAIQATSGATDTVTMMGTVRDDVLATLTADDGEVATARVTSTGAMWVQSAILDAAAGAAATSNPVQVGGVYTNSPLTLDAGDAGYILLDVNGRVQISDGAGALNVICDSGCSGGTQYTQDAALTVATTIGTMAMGRASAAAPTDVSADNDAVLPWYLRSGALAVQLTNAGVLTLSGSGTATGALRVELPTNGTGVIATVTNVATIGTSVTPGTAAGNLGKAEDAGVGSGDTGVAVLFQAQATPTATAADNDYILAKTNANGVLWTQPISTSATGAAPPATASFIAGLQSGATGGFLGGIPVCDSFANVNVSTGTTTLIVTGVSGRHVRICSLNLVTAAANNVAFISGTGATCGTGTTAMNGSTTAATGWNFAANGGIAQGGGLGAINQTNATGDSVCIVTSAATQLSGRVAYTIY